MPAYTLPGAEVGPRRARALGVSAILVVALVIVGWRVVPHGKPSGRIHVDLVTSHVGEGIHAGTDVRLNGVRVGRVDSIDVTGPGRQRIGLELTQSQLFGLTDAMSVDYAPGNLFGISALELHANPGGAVLADGTSVDVTAADRLRDATLATLLESTGRLTDGVLTPKLTDLLATLSRDVDAFVPLLQAMGATIHAYTDTQRLATSALFESVGSALAGVPSMLTGGLEVLHAAFANQYFQSPDHISRYSQMFSIIQYQLLPTATATTGTAGRYFGGFIPIATALLGPLAASVATPDRSTRDLTELLDRLNAAFHDTPGGPTVNLQVELDMVPALAVPLSAMVGGHVAAGGH